MGNKKSCPLKNKEVEALVQTAKGRFSAQEVKSLHAHFMLVSSIDHNDKLIDMSEFGTCMGLERSTYLQQRIFNVFDKDGDGTITTKD